MRAIAAIQKEDWSQFMLKYKRPAIEQTSCFKKESLCGKVGNDGQNLSQ